MKLLPSLLALAISTALPAPAADFDLVGREMARLLQNGHYARLPFNDKLGSRIFDDYLNDLDPEHLYFTAGDISDLSRKYRRKLHIALLNGQAMEMAQDIYTLYQTRVRERVLAAQKLLKENQWTFDGERTVPRDRKDIPWPISDAEAQAQWRLEVERALLAEIIEREDSKNRAAELKQEDPFKGQPTPQEKLSNQYERILQTAEKADEEAIANALFSSVARAHDPHTEYLSARETDQFFADMSNQLVGIGAHLTSESDGSTRITGIVIGGPADRDGDLMPDDRIIAVDPLGTGQWIDTTFLPLDRVIEHIKGKANTEVGLRIQGEQPKEISIQRGLVKMQADLVSSKIFTFHDENSKLGYLKVPEFYYDPENRSRNVSVNVEKTLRRMNKEAVDGLIIDMRNNGGGSLSEVSRMVGLFIGRGPVVQVKSNNGQIISLGEKNYRKPIFTKPVILLTNRLSASATEIFAAAMQDYQRAVVVGSSFTYGKGTVQTPQKISNFMPFLADRERAGQLKYTIQKYYRPSGGSVQLRGVIPDIILPSVRDHSEIGEQFERHALPYDTIRKAKGFRPTKNQHLFLPALQSQSATRIAASQDFTYIQEDLIRIQKLKEENQLSLNRETRRAELLERETRRKMRHAEMRQRFATIEKADQKRFTTLRLSLADLKTKSLPVFDPEAEKNRFIRRAKDHPNQLENRPEWPNDLDYIEREAIAILQDLISLKKTGHVVHLKKSSSSQDFTPSSE